MMNPLCENVASSTVIANRYGQIERSKTPQIENPEGVLNRGSALGMQFILGSDR